MSRNDREARAPAVGRRSLLWAAAGVMLLAMMGQAISALAAQGEVRTVVIPVEGMACVACAASVKRALKAIDGVATVEVSLERRSAQVTYMPAKVTPERLVAAITRLGYRAGVPRKVE